MARDTDVEALRHDDRRVNIPTGELRDFVAEDEALPRTIRYPRDPSLDPQLVWRGKDEQDADDLTVPSVPIYIQEKIQPRALIEDLRRRSAAGASASDDELRLFDDFNGIEFEELVDFYAHDQNWSNRLILGDSLQVMTSLADKERLAGQVQMIYMDPPYGIKFGSNWQVSTRKRDVRDGKADDLTRQPEMIKAYRDTWELGVHSYLSYLRDRLTVARELLSETGSIFVQIGDENVHLVRSVLDETFGAGNFVSIITFSTTTTTTGRYLPATTSFVLWYGKNTDRLKYRPLYQTKQLGGGGSSKYDQLQMPDGTRLPLAKASAAGTLPDGHRVFRLDNLTSPRVREARTGYFPVRIGTKEYLPQRGEWKTNREGMARLALADRLQATSNSVAYIRYLQDFPAYPLGNVWLDVGGVQSRADPKVYVVQTSTAAVERCMLMATDPGDLVLDPTCGSGTTAVASERWGRRWITIDTSRVALALARTRFMSIQHPSYLLADSPEGRAREAEVSGQAQPDAPTRRDVKKGFVYRRVPHVTLKSIAQNPDIRDGMTREEIDAAIARHADIELLRDQPYEAKGRVRVTGPFTVESLSPHRVLSTDEEQPASERLAAREPEAVSFEQLVLDNLRKSGVQNTVRAERLAFTRLDPFPGRWLQAEGEYLDAEGELRRVAVSLGPEHGTVGPEQVKEAAKEAIRGRGFDVLVVCGFSFDARAGETAREFTPQVPTEASPEFAVSEETRSYGRLPVLLARMNPDLTMAGALKTSEGANLFMVFGEPDLAISRSGDEVTVEVRGLDVYDPTTGEVRTNSTDDIACWFLDTDYDGESFFVRHAYFTGADDPYARLKRSLRADIDEDAWASLHRTTSRPFLVPTTGKIAVKLINHYGDEVLKVYNVPSAMK